MDVVIIQLNFNSKTSWQVTLIYSTDNHLEFIAGSLEPAYSH